MIFFLNYCFVSQSSVLIYHDLNFSQLSFWSYSVLILNGIYILNLMKVSSHRRVHVHCTGKFPCVWSPYSKTNQKLHDETLFKLRYFTNLIWDCSRAGMGKWFRIWKFYFLHWQSRDYAWCLNLRPLKINWKLCKNLFFAPQPHLHIFLYALINCSITF